MRFTEASYEGITGRSFAIAQDDTSRVSFFAVSCASTNGLRHCKSLQKLYPFYEQGDGFPIGKTSPSAAIGKICYKTKEKDKMIFYKQTKSEGNCNYDYKACLVGKTMTTPKLGQAAEATDYVQFIYDEADANLLKLECKNDSDCSFFQ